MRKFLLLLVILGLFGYFVWPTQYKEYSAGEGPYADQIGKVASRVDRISGEVFIKTGSDDWRKVPVRRPDLLRPDITGPTPSPKVDRGVVDQQQNTINSMQETTDAATKDAQNAVTR